MKLEPSWGVLAPSWSHVGLSWRQVGDLGHYLELLKTSQEEFRDFHRSIQIRKEKQWFCTAQGVKLGDLGCQVAHLRHLGSSWRSYGTSWS